MFSPSTYEAAHQWLLALLMQQYIPGYLGKPVDGGSYEFFVPGRAGFCFVRIWKGESVTIDICVNTVAPLEPNGRIWMQRFGGVLRVAFADPIDAANLYGNNVGAAGVPAHVPASDTSSVSGARIFDRQVHAPAAAYAGLNVCVEAGLTPWGYRVREPNDDLTGNTPPTSGNRWWVLCYEDSTGVHFSTTGSVETAMAVQDMVLDNGGDASIAAMENLTIPTGSVPLAGIVLDNGQTVVDANTRIVDWRLHFGTEGASAFYQTVQDNGTPQTQRANLNFIGATVADNPGNDSTDVTPTGGGTGALVKITNTVLGSPAASIAFSSISSSYKHLVIEGMIRTVEAVTNSSWEVYLNADNAGTSYPVQQLLGNSGTPSSAAAAGRSTLRSVNCPGSTATANHFAAFKMTIFNYADTGKYKTILIESTSFGNNTVSNFFVELITGMWFSTAAVTAVTFQNNGGNNLDTGTDLTIYGLS